MAGTVNTHPKWNYNQFICFILLYASMADLEFSDEECKLILSKVDESSMEQIKAEMESNSDYERLQIIGKYREKYFATPEQKAEILVKIEELFESDGTYARTEHNLFMMLRKLL